MTEKHKRGPDGLLSDGVSTYPATAADLATYTQAQQALSQLQAPVLYHAKNPYERLFVAAFDGTANDAISDPEHATHIGRFNEQLEALQQRDQHVRVEYVEGPGTQDRFIPALIDKATGHTYNARLEQMYFKFITQAAKWRQEDPQADIRLIGTGFSRGAEQAAGYARLLHERGIQDPSGRIETRDAHGNTVVEYTKPPLVPPGQVAQALGLFDPVGTGEPAKHDRRLPPSVLSAVQIVARDEKRDAFPSTRIVPDGLSEDGRTLSVTVAGAHSNIGGSYHLNGLGARSGNLMANYFNALSDTPLVQRQPEPLDPRLNVIHRTEEHFRVFGINLYDTSNFRENGLRDERAPAPFCRAVNDCGPPEPVNAALSARFEHHPVTVTPAPAEPELSLERGSQPMPVSAIDSRSPRVSATDGSVAPLPVQPELDRDTLHTLQGNLNRLGFTDARGRPLPHDASYCAETRSAVYEFQREQGLPATGIADDFTLKAVQAHVLVADLQQQKAEREAREPFSLQRQAQAYDARLAEPVPPPRPGPITNGAATLRATQQPLHAFGMYALRGSYSSPFVPQPNRPIEATATPEPYHAAGRVEHSAGPGRTPLTQPEAHNLHAPQGEPLIYADPTHPNHRLYQELRNKLPANVSDEKVAELTLASREGGVRPGQVESVHVHDGKAWVLGTSLFDGLVDLRTPAPPLSETMRRAEAYELQEAQRIAQWQEQEQQRQSQSPGRSP